MANCAMMNGVDWRELTFWEYTALVYQWNARHTDEKPEPETELDRDLVRGMMERTRQMWRDRGESVH